MAKNYVVQTTIGKLELCISNGYIFSSKFVDDRVKISTNVDQHLLKDLKNYFGAKSKELNSKIKLVGTDFQIRVWKEILKIPYGSTKTYGEIAKDIGEPNSSRAVANACGQNPVAIFVPCHRVVGKNDVGGYKWGIDKKEWLLDMELCGNLG